MIEVSHWYENIMLLGMVALFIADGTALMAAIGTALAIVVYILEIAIDNGFARMTWQSALKSGWVIALILGVLNVAALLYL